MYDFKFADSAVSTFSMLRQTWAAANKVSETKLAKANLTPEKLAVLWACRDYPGTLTPAEIARLLFRENQSIAGLLNRMEKEGLVKRVPKRKGKPYTEVKITPKCEQLCGPGLPIIKTVITELAKSLTPQQHEQLQSLLQIFRDKALEMVYIEPRETSCFPPGEPVRVNW